MTERKGRKAPVPAAPVQGALPATRRPRPRDADDAERSLGRVVSVALPALSVSAAVVVGAVAGLGSALLVLASGALLGTIALLWASVRTLSGDAPLPADLEALGARRHGVDELSEQKDRVLRALKDLETEHALGKIDDADYRAFVSRYRDEAKSVMRQMDLVVAPLREAAERMAREYLEKQKRGGQTPEAAPDLVESRPTCGSCGTSNEPDAAFCKKCGAALQETGDAEKVDAAH